MSKAHIRAKVLARLRAMPTARRDAASAALRARLHPLLRDLQTSLGRPLRVALYAPLPHEVNLMPLLQEEPQHRYAFPRCLPGRRMLFHEVSSPAEELVAGAHGILAPHASLPSLRPQELDVLVVPGVAFTARGERLGYGGGYYDRYLPHCTQACVLALAFEEQMEETLPTEAHDLRLPQVLHQ